MAQVLLTRRRRSVQRFGRLWRPPYPPHPGRRSRAGRRLVIGVVSYLRSEATQCALEFLPRFASRLLPPLMPYARHRSLNTKMREQR